VYSCRCEEYFSLASDGVTCVGMFLCFNYFILYLECKLCVEDTLRGSDKTQGLHGYMFTHESYMAFKTTSLNMNITLKLQFLRTSVDSLIFYTGHTTGRDFLSLTLVDGKLVVR
jgi:hypothetical protein